MDYALHVPINPVSFGQVSMGILTELYARKANPCIFPIGNIDLSAFKVDQDFVNWLQDCANKAVSTHNRKNPTVKLWHLDGSLESFSEKQVLFTFYELDSPTKFETNIARNQSKVLVTNKYTVKNFEAFGLTNVEVVPLGFDARHFRATNKKYFQDDRIVFNLVGKLEHRKHHVKVIRAWLKKYGNDTRFYLNAAIYNPFFKPEDNASLFTQATEGKRYSNVGFLNFMQQNELYNEYLNSGHIVLAMSGAEGWGLGEFHSVALGKFCVGLNAHGYKEWMNESNAVLVNPSGKVDSHDGVFFQRGRPFNQGNIFDWDEEEFLSACDKAVALYQSEKVNTKGLELQKTFTYSKTVDAILKNLETVCS